jgi:hypothetical protein
MEQIPLLTLEEPRLLMLNGSRDLRLRGSMAAFGLSSDALLSQRRAFHGELRRDAAAAGGFKACSSSLKCSLLL